MTASAYIRELIRTGGNIDTSYPEDRARVIRVIAGIANNINQAVKLGNSQGRLYYSDIDKLQNSLDDSKEKQFGEGAGSMAITKILNIMESEGRNPASHLKNALEYIQNPDKTEECVLVGGINCLPDTAFEQMEETKNIFHKTGKRQGYHVIISFSPEEKVTAEQAMYVLEHFAKDVLGDDYEAVYAVHTDREHMHGHLIWNSVSMTTGKKYNSPKSNWKNHLQPITNKYCDELGLSIMPAEYSRNPKNISRDKWEKEMSMKEIILRDAKMCAYAAGNVEHFKYLMKRLGYVFKKDAWMEVQAPGFRYYHKLAKLDEMF